MNSYLEALGLPEDRVIDIGKTYRGYAHALEKEELGKIDKNSPWIASSYLISASFFLLTDSSSAKKMFYSAALSYQKLGVPFWKVCAICANNFDGILNTKEKLDNDAFFDNSRKNFYDILESFYNSQNYFEPFVSDKLYKGKLQRIGIPYQLVFEVMVESNNWNKHFSALKSSVNKFSELLRRTFEPIVLSKSDNFHWSNVQGTILPFEPQALAIIVTFTKKWIQYHHFNELLNLVDANNDQKILLLVANNIVSGEERSFFKE